MPSPEEQAQREAADAAAREAAETERAQLLSQLQQRADAESQANKVRELVNAGTAFSSGISGAARLPLSTSDDARMALQKALNTRLKGLDKTAQGGSELPLAIQAQAAMSLMREGGKQDRFGQRQELSKDKFENQKKEQVESRKERQDKASAPSEKLVKEIELTDQNIKSVDEAISKLTDLVNDPELSLPPTGAPRGFVEMLKGGAAQLGIGDGPDQRIKDLNAVISRLTSVDRNQLFGSALTDTEKAAYDRIVGDIERSDPETVLTGLRQFKRFFEEGKKRRIQAAQTRESKIRGSVPTTQRPTGMTPEKQKRLQELRKKYGR